MTKEAVVENVNSLKTENLSLDIKGDFCKAWPTIRQGLELLKSIVPALTFFINLVEAGGDALSKKICG